ncbi:MOG interacting and ectopic P-granules protein 1 isoform X2 [Anoplophora glabripennis]|uniref:MOG interacting and ectopic P-granules protein 1 isoform X2 n=1 Tax=Anoplophora glabripennis TaxID=217634 RepID=UPI0008744650|nr:MOG interacting and ectopic P-granules protein 1 isoform X2 [Anoplophora glabripennis]
MAAVADMGEVDEVHSKEEGSVVNGELSNDVDMDNQDSQDSIKKSSLPDSMEVDESENENIEAKETTHEAVSTTEESTEENTAEESSVATENLSDINEDESSQETKMSEDQIEEGPEEIEECVEHPDEEPQRENNENSASPIEDQDSKDETCDSIATSEKQDEKHDEIEKDVDCENKIVEINEEDEVHEIESDDDDNSKGNKINCTDEPIELNDSGGEGDGDVMIVDPPKENGEVIDLDATPEKKIKSLLESITPRRSTRNLNKNRSYAESDKEEEEASAHSSEESDIEEVLPQDPLACSDAITVEKVPADKSKSVAKPSTIVVKDTKRLVEIASKSNNTSQGKKEPTLVIIDTNSILSGRGPVPVSNKTPSSAISTSTYPSMLPMALPAQGMYPPNMRATITPIPMNTPNITSTPPPKTSPATITPTLATPLLPTLTDDMFVVEAPSFIVPYVYEKPPVKDLRDFIKGLEAVKVNQKKSEDAENEDGDGEKSEDGSKSKSEDGSKSKKDDDEKQDAVDKEDTKKEEPKKEFDDSKKPYSYFESPLGKFFINIGFNMVQEFVQSDLLKQQKRKRDREGGTNPETEKTIKSLAKNLEYSKENNEPFKNPIKKCEFCNFKTESALAMAYHLETPHMKNFVYKCNFCPYEVRSPHDILFHMEAEHAVRGHLERAPAFHQCPNCPFEDNQKGKLSRHLVACMRKFKPERNLEPPVDWEPPAKIPRVPKMRQQGLNATAAAYQAMSKTSQYQFLSKMQLQSTQQAMQRGRGRPSLGNVKPQTVLRPSGMVFKQQAMAGGSVLVPTNYQLSGNQVFQTANQGKKPTQQPSISITPLPRVTTATASPVAPAKPGDTTSKNSFVICEICDGYIKDLEQLRNHMQWIHKIKIHPKMIYNRPPLNCQKCQFRFFTDQGLERHLLGSHGLVTSSMQDAANKSKDSGRCPVCGRVYQWKLLNHVARDHNMTLKPAHLSYKCTVCTATFGMYKQFENHVYSAHSVVAKRVMDKKSASSSPAAANKSDQMKPLKINDEITIIPQPAKSTNGASKEGSPSSTGSNNSRNSTPSTSKSR